MGQLPLLVRAVSASLNECADCCGGGLAAMICIGLCLGFECVTAILILSLRSVIGYLFVNDEDVVHLVSKIA